MGKLIGAVVIAAATTLFVTAWLMPRPVLAAPPAVGAYHEFRDPLFRNTVVCDELAQVRQIALAASPSDAYFALRVTPNAKGEPTCAAMMPRGTVLGVLPIGVMVWGDSDEFQAWAVKYKATPTVDAWALYLEAKLPPVKL